jgi:hypothetical protein
MDEVEILPPCNRLRSVLPFLHGHGTNPAHKTQNAPLCPDTATTSHPGDYKYNSTILSIFALNKENIQRIYLDKSGIAFSETYIKFV